MQIQNENLQNNIQCIQNIAGKMRVYSSEYQWRNGQEGKDIGRFPPWHSCQCARQRRKQWFSKTNMQSMQSIIKVFSLTVVTLTCNNLNYSKCKPWMISMVW